MPSELPEICVKKGSMM